MGFFTNLILNAGSKSPEVIIKVQTTLKTAIMESVKSNLADTTNMSNQQVFETGLVILTSELEMRKDLNKSYWITWTTEDLYQQLFDVAGLTRTDANKVAKCYMTFCFDVMSSMTSGNTVNYNELVEQIMANPELDRYINGTL